ncbi:hypothetical protein DYU05_20200 [Mucilaginibacter terrenus]|uniref:Uncharacterized protein n=1 Tax=Mucilaginibacter terrenus TaxID=2482727 RepID=A0A3E2NJA0_9SPHI|nr:hypothetical protein [Mucilaginibacter terrenus]RFZ81084.1 hypothetical protein DYU05_20200 [Mucilaginibacter terrenus]
MKTITIAGDPASLCAVWVPKSDIFHDHDVVRVESSDGHAAVEKTIFRIVDGGEDKWELQFE